MNTEITTRRLILKKIKYSDLQILLKWRNSNEFLTYCTTRNPVITLEEFIEELEKDLSKDRYCQYLIYRRLGMVPIGTVYCYNLNKKHGYCFITIFISRDVWNSGFGAEAFAALSVSLFKDLQDLHKIYIEVYSCNLRSISCLKNAGVVLEGHFKEHCLVNGLRCDLLRFALFRSQLKSFQKLFLWIGVTGCYPIHK